MNMGYKYLYYDLTKFSAGNTLIAQPPHGKIWKIIDIYGVLTGTSSSSVTLSLVKQFTLYSNNSVNIKVYTANSSTSIGFYIGKYFMATTYSNTINNYIILTEFDQFIINLSITPASPSFIYILITEEDA
jgi:hypothetical protein